MNSDHAANEKKTAAYMGNGRRKQLLKISEKKHFTRRIFQKSWDFFRNRIIKRLMMLEAWRCATTYLQRNGLFWILQW